MNQYDRIYYQLTRDAGRLGGLPLWLAFRALPALVGGAMLLLLLWAAPGRAMVPGEGDASAMDGLASGQMLLQADHPRPLHAGDIAGQQGAFRYQRHDRHRCGGAILPQRYRARTGGGVRLPAAGQRRRALYGNGHRRAPYCRQDSRAGRGPENLRAGEDRGQESQPGGTAAPESVYQPGGQYRRRGKHHRAAGICAAGGLRQRRVLPALSHHHHAALHAGRALGAGRRGRGIRGTGRQSLPGLGAAYRPGARCGCHVAAAVPPGGR